MSVFRVAVALMLQEGEREQDPPILAGDLRLMKRQNAVVYRSLLWCGHDRLEDDVKPFF